MRFVHSLRTTLFSTAFILLAASPSFPQQRVPSADLQNSSRAFVQEFYNWYLSNATVEGFAWLDMTLKKKSTSFSPELLGELNEYASAPPNPNNEIDGLDFDFFLNAQDFAERYEVGDATCKQERCLVEVFAVSSGKRSAKPDVVPEVVLQDGRWRFVNFHYGKSDRSADENLVAMLKAIRADRRAASSKPSSR